MKDTSRTDIRRADIRRTDIRRADTWRIGVLFSSSGVTAAIETTQAHATMLAVEEINASGGVLGRPLQPVIYDPQSSPRLFRSLAARLLTEDKVRIIFGCYMSSTRKAVLPEVEAHRGLLFYPTLYEGFEYSSRCIYTGAAPNQNSLQLAQFLMENYGSKFLLVGSNYVYPYESNRVMTDLVVQAKGKIADEIYVPLECKPSDFTRVIKEINRLKPNVIFSTVVGAGTAMFYRAYHEAGFDSSIMPIASLTTSEAEVAEMAPEVAAGHITAAPFFEDLATDEARRFIADFRQRFGPDAPVTACAEAAYFQVKLYAEALRRAGTDNPDILVPNLLGLEYDAPQGRVRIDPDNHHTELWPRLARVNKSGRFEIVWNPETRVKPDPYFIAPPLDDWSVARLLTSKPA
jgi:branched-chain amino acid transport system substrate-binding protein